MKQLVCEMCGGKDLIKQDSVFVCQNCQTKYSVEEAKKMMIETDYPAKLENENSEPLNPPEEQSSSSLDLGSFTTPEKTTKSFAPGGCSLFIIGIFVIAIIGAIISPEESQTQKNISNIKDQKIEAEVQLKQSIKANLREPKSYQNIETDVYTVEEYIFVKHTFRGKNRFGGYEVCTFVARFNFNTKPLEWGITNNPRSNSGCRNIMIALP